MQEGNCRIKRDVEEKGRRDRENDKEPVSY